jgi:hypothetical protein
MKHYNTSKMGVALLDFFLNASEILKVENHTTMSSVDKNVAYSIRYYGNIILRILSLSVKRPLFHKEQQDATENLFLLNILHNNFLDVFRYVKVESFKCKNCQVTKKSHANLETMFFLQKSNYINDKIKVDNPVNFAKILLREEEYVDADCENENCSKKSENNNILKTTSVTTLPEIICVSFKPTYELNTNRPIRDHVFYTPEHFSVSLKNGQKMNYQKISEIFRTGEGVEGHYVANILHENNIIRFDDTTTTFNYGFEKSEKKIRELYCVFYHCTENEKSVTKTQYYKPMQNDETLKEDIKNGEDPVFDMSDESFLKEFYPKTELVLAPQDSPKPKPKSKTPSPAPSPAPSRSPAEKSPSRSPASALSSVSPAPGTGTKQAKKNPASAPSSASPAPAPGTDTTPPAPGTGTGTGTKQAEKNPSTPPVTATGPQTRSRSPASPKKSSASASASARSSASPPAGKVPAEKAPATNKNYPAKKKVARTLFQNTSPTGRPVTRSMAQVPEISPGRWTRSRTAQQENLQTPKNKKPFVNQKILEMRQIANQEKAELLHKSNEVRENLEKFQNKFKGLRK